ncbi:hypothetical protein QJS10_CPB17g00005 [Acorus calamus]|uniref:Uncharacterized protein n=1 Tax=Acorus calamus TaxID=4465 RepID=A0AAV9CUN6_ACOCL|nr:hypothetical protein QJS10_CPB17g00005 [Acorus calamus]
MGSRRGVAREISGGRLESKASQEQKRSKAFKVSIVGFHRCRSKKIDNCDHFNRIGTNSTDDDKRAVPTGPNPLHNR